MSSEIKLQTYSVSLFFQKDSALAIKDVIINSAIVSKNFYVLEKNIPPHISLAMFKIREDQLEEAEKIIAELNIFFQNEIEDKEFEFNKIDDFRNRIVFFTFEENPELFELLKRMNLKLHELFHNKFSPACNNQYLPENFYPHCAFARGLSYSQITKVYKYFQENPFEKKLKFEKLMLCKKN